MLKRNLQEHDFFKYHFGYFIALNQMDFSLKTNQDLIGQIYSTDLYSKDFPDVDSIEFNSVHAKPTKGFTVGIIANLKLSKYFDLRFIPSLAFGERKLNYSFSKILAGGAFEQKDIEKSIISTHVDLPFHVKYQSERSKNFRAYVLSGVKFSIDLSSNSEKNKEANEEFLRLKYTDLLFEAGVGVNYYFNFFKFGIELKMAYGLKNLIDTENNVYADALASIHSKIFQLSITFE